MFTGGLRRRVNFPDLFGSILTSPFFSVIHSGAVVNEFLNVCAQTPVFVKVKFNDQLSPAVIVMPVSPLRSAFNGRSVTSAGVALALNEGVVFPARTGATARINILSTIAIATHLFKVISLNLRLR